MPRAGFKQSSGLFPSSLFEPAESTQEVVTTPSTTRAVVRLSSCDSARKVPLHRLGFHARGSGSFCGGSAGNTGNCRFDIRSVSTRCMPGNSSSVRTPGRRFGTTPARTRSNSSRTGWPCRLANFLQRAKRDVPLHVNKERISRSACLACRLSPLSRKPCACCYQRISVWARMHIGLLPAGYVTSGIS